MAYKIKKKVGRPISPIKIRNLEGITPKNYTFVKAKGNLAYYKRIS